MSRGVNKAIVIGNIGKDPEVNHTQGGQAVCNLSVATNERWKDKNGVDQERTEWHRVVVWGKSAEACAKYLKKGRMVYVEGRLQTREWEDKEGIKRYSTEIFAQDVQFLGGAGGAGGRGDNEPPPYSDDDAPSGGGGSRQSDDDVPF
jgi:single-strand DNA-binding protein